MRKTLTREQLAAALEVSPRMIDRLVTAAGLRPARRLAGRGQASLFTLAAGRRALEAYRNALPRGPVAPEEVQLAEVNSRIRDTVSKLVFVRSRWLPEEEWGPAWAAHVQDLREVTRPWAERVGGVVGRLTEREALYIDVDPPHGDLPVLRPLLEELCTHVGRRGSSLARLSAVLAGELPQQPALPDTLEEAKRLERELRIEYRHARAQARGARRREVVRAALDDAMAGFRNAVWHQRLELDQYAGSAEAARGAFAAALAGALKQMEEVRP
jgi:hypothetical protein